MADGESFESMLYLGFEVRIRRRVEERDSSYMLFESSNVAINLMIHARYPVHVFKCDSRRVELISCATPMSD